MSFALENALIAALEATLAALPRRAPTAGQLESARIVAHRGERDDVIVKENTLAAFDAALAGGIAAIEFDVRYTRDDEPIICHDATLARVFNEQIAVAEIDWCELRDRVPEVAHLQEIVARYAHRATLMIELKTRGSAQSEARLRACLQGLEPARDFYFLALDTALFDACGTWPAAACIPVAKRNWRRLFDWAMAHDCGGIAGPFLFIRPADIARLQADDAFIGSGFVRRRGLLLREIGRGIPWIFTNQPIALQRMLDQARRQAAL